MEKVQHNRINSDKFDMMKRNDDVGLAEFVTTTPMKEKFNMTSAFFDFPPFLF